MKRVLVTGATGFLGRPCVAALAAGGYEVHGATRRVAGRKGEEGTRWHEADLLEDGEAERLIGRVRPTHLLHLAWTTEAGSYWTSPDNLRWVGATLALARAFREAGGERLLCAGTCAEYDWKHGMCSEAHTPLRPASLYGACKHATQVVLSAYAAQTGLRAAWARLFFLFGPGEPGNKLVTSIARALLAKQPARCAAGKLRRDYLYVEDAAAALVALLSSGAIGAVNIGSGHAVPLGDIARAIAGALDMPGLLHVEDAPAAGEAPLIQADVRLLSAEVGWRPSFDLEAGLRATLAGLRGQGRLPITGTAT